MVSEEFKDEERGIFPVVNNEKEKKKKKYLEEPVCGWK